MRPSVEALPGDSNAAVTVVSTDAANENMSNQEMDMTESLFSERDMPRPRADVTYQSRRYRHITVFDVRKLIASDHRNQPQQPPSFVVAHAPDQAHRYAALIPVLTGLFVVALISISLVKYLGDRNVTKAVEDRG